MAVELLDIEQAADRLSVSPRFMRTLVTERRIPFLKLGKFVRFDAAELDLWLDSRRVAAVD